MSSTAEISSTALEPSPGPKGAPRSRWFDLAVYALIATALILVTLGLGREYVRYFLSGVYIDHIESNTVIIAWQYAWGTPIYAMQDGAPRLATFYGPLAYLSELPALLLAGPGITVSKLTSLLALLATIGLTTVRFCRLSSPTQAAHGLLFLFAGLAAMSPMSFWVRPDSLETLLVAIGIAGAANPLCLGLCIGLAVNLKVHAFVYFLPLVFELWLTRGWRGLLLLALPAGATFFFPFLLPGVSLHEYVMGLAQQADGRRPAMEMLPKVLTFFVLLALPVALSLEWRESPARDRRFAVAALTTLLILLYPASILGAGEYHFLPFVPVLAEARRRLPIKSSGAMFAPFLLLIAASLVMQRNLDNLRQRDGWDRLANEALELAQHSQFSRSTSAMETADAAMK